MSHSLTLPDDLYARLDTAARRQGLTIAEWLRLISSDTTISAAELKARQDAVARSAALYDDLAVRYGGLPDSTDLIREDRDR